MKNFYDSVRSERQLKSLTGLGKSKFEELLQALSPALVEITNEKYRRNRKKRSLKQEEVEKANFQHQKINCFLYSFI